MAVDQRKKIIYLAVVLVVLYSSTMRQVLDTNVDRFPSKRKRVQEHLYSGESTIMPEQFMDAEQLRRQVGRDVRQAWQFLRFHLLNLSSSNLDLGALLEDLGHSFRVTSHDLARLAEVDELQEWRRREAAALSALVQHRLRVLQNPRDCASAKKIYCDFTGPGRGIGSQLHHLSYCFLASYGTQRTLILNTKNFNGNPRGLDTFFLPLSDTCTTYNHSQMVLWPGKDESSVVLFPAMDRPRPRPSYFPKSVPKDISERLVRLHGDPFAWWIGQFFKYSMRMSKEFQEYIENLAQKIGYESPVVGLQIRRTDKLISEAAYVSLEVYMEEVEDFYQELELHQPVAQRKIFLATDDPEIIPEMKKKYPEYKVVYHKASLDSTPKKKRKSESSLRYFLADIYFLSRSDYLVCGMTSNICRLAYELMQALHPDASDRASSVDREYFFHYEGGDVAEARFPHKPRRPLEMELRKGDLVDRRDIPSNFVKHPSKRDGFQWGRNTRTKRRGFYPVFKTIEKMRVADVKSFEHIDKMNKSP
ncbi:alpha-(1,6)-fucosyltransferase-like [Penaeus japonicus]|uniref:alpha-(1,6)-fucosyltransferase-like n=1 Tax=Penaeus japonicus TaxID=27405 RepID=UPI001C7163CE|nr:alpha-(1,6)-fucosyltransferase-like [Penaeus japonicus]